MKKKKVKDYMYNELLLNLEAEGYEIYNIEEREWETSFKIKDLKNWTWWVWKQDNEDYPLVMFALHDLFIDKVKPSYADMAIPIPKDFNLELAAADIDYMMAHEALVFTGMEEEQEFKAIIRMKKAIFKVKFELWRDKRVHKKLCRWAAVGGFTNSFKVIYIPDTFNEDEFEHLNDRWYIFADKWIGKVLAAAMNRMQEKCWKLGSLFIFNEDEDKFRWEALCSAGACSRLKNEDGTWEVDDDEVWSVLWELDYEDKIKIYGEV